MDALLITYGILAAAACLQVGLLFLNVWEQERHHCRRFDAPLQRSFTPSVLLVAPCKGLDLELAENLRALFTLDYPACELCFVVQEADDPATRVIEELRREHPQVRVRLVTAGVAQSSGQKVHNLLAATRPIPAGIEVLAFVDSDARPHRDWLYRLVQRLENGKRGVATGYRWMRPARATLPNLLLSAINNTIIALAGPHGFNLVWGGAWAIRTETFFALGLPDRWEGTLSDDLVVSRIVHDAGLKVGYEPHCLVNSSVDFTWAGLFEFLRRQFLVVRVYAPLWYRSALVLGLLTNGLMTGSLVLAVVWTIQGLPGWLPAAVALSLYGLNALKNSLGLQVFRRFVRAGDVEFARVGRWNIWGWPVVMLVNWIGLVLALFGRTICWRGINYRLVSRFQTKVTHPDQCPLAAVPRGGGVSPTSRSPVETTGIRAA